MSLRDQILEHSNRTADRVVAIPEWGLEEVHLRRLSLAAHEQVQSDLRDKPPEVRARVVARMLINHCVDVDGRKVFDFDGAVSVLVTAEQSIVNRLAMMISGDMPLLNTAPPRPGAESDEDRTKNV